MTRFFGTITVIVLVGGAIPCAMARPENMSEPPTLEAVREGLMARNGLFHNMNFRVIFKGRDQHIRGGPWRERLQAIDGVCDENRCERADILELPTHPAVIAATKGEKVHSLITFTPEGNRSLSMSIDGKKTPIGIIQKQCRITWLNHPLDIVGLAYFSPLKYLGDTGYGNSSVEGMETIRGQEVVRVAVRWKRQDAPRDESNLIYWFNPAHGYALVCSEQEWRPKGEMALKVVKRVDHMDFTRQGPLWLPGKVEFHDYNYDEKGYGLNREFTATFSNWSINAPIPDGTFSIDFPDGTVVRDDIKNVTYLKGSLNDPAIKGQVARAKKLGPDTVAKVQAPSDPTLLGQFQEAKRDDPYAARDMWRWVVGTSATFLAIGGIIALGYSRRGRGRAA